MQDLNDKITGGVLTAAEWNEVPSEIQNVIEGLGIVLSSGDLNQLGKSIAGYVANGNFYTDSGIADAYVLTQIGLKQAATAYTNGFKVSFVAGNDNAGASTVNVASLGVKNLKTIGGGVVPLGFIKSGESVTATFDGTDFILSNPLSNSILPFDTLDDAKTSTFLRDGSRFKTAENSTGNGGGGTYAVVLTSSVTPLPANADGTDIIESTANPLISFVLIVDGVVALAQLGAVNGGDISAIFNRAVVIASEVIDHGGSYIIDDTLLVTANKKIRMGGIGLTIFTAKSTLTSKNMLDLATGADNIEISGIKFDNRNDIITPNFASTALENIINGKSNSNLSIHDCEFDRSLNRSIIIDAIVSDVSQKIDIERNKFTDGSRGAINIVRFCGDVSIKKNTFTNTVDSSIGSIAFEKSVSISGVTDCWIDRNIIVQTNGDTAAIIIEFVDTESKNVWVTKNRSTYTGVSGVAGNNIKVGASNEVYVLDNILRGGGASNVFFEGVLNGKIKGNKMFDAGESSVKLTDDAQTLRTNRNIEIDDNHFEDPNQLGAALGTPVTTGGANNSYAVQCFNIVAGLKVRNNTFKDSGDTFNGLLITATDYDVTDNDFTLLNVNRITIDNHFSSTSTDQNIKDNKDARTTNTDIATILSGTNNLVVNPETVHCLASQTRPLATAREALSGSAITFIAATNANNLFLLQTKDSSNASTNVSADTDFTWQVDISRTVNAIMGKNT